MPRQQHAGQLADRGEAREIGERRLDPIRAGGLARSPAGAFAAAAVAAEHHDPQAGPGEPDCGVQPDPGAGSGDDCDPFG